MNILITDDERLVRVNLCSMIEELYPGEHRICQAADGAEMVRMVGEAFYDMVFLDINMPKINGLDALDTCRELSPETCWCILTGYAEFEYAKRSISLGAAGYLLKPLDIEELKCLMDAVIREKEEGRKNKGQIFESRMSLAISLADSVGVVNQMQPEREGAVYSIYLFFLDTEKPENRRELYAGLYDDLSKYLQKNIDVQDKYALFFLQTSELCLLIEGNEYARLQSYLKIHWKAGDVRARTVAIWSTATDFAELYMNKQIILAMSSLRMLEENGKVISLQELKEQKNLLKRQYLCEKIEMLTAAYMTGNYVLANELLHEMEQDDSLKTGFDLIDRRPLADYLSMCWNEGCGEGDFSELLSQFGNAVQDSLSCEHGKKNDVIAQIKEYVSANYMNDVTIAEIGSRFAISPSYISRIFREKTGEKYIDFVTAVRMKKAMEFLQKEPSVSVKEVAARVGYVSEKHFSKMFKRYYDLLPSQINSEKL